MGRERETGRETEREGSARPFGCVQAKKREIESLHLAGITGLLEAIKQQVVSLLVAAKASESEGAHT